MFVFLSFADTVVIPLTSIEKLTSIWGTPLGACSIPERLNLPNNLLSAANCLSPWTTEIVTSVWLFSAVEKICDLVTGIVVFLGINGVAIPPNVSIPKVKGVTSSNKTSLISPAKTPPWIAAPIATTSSGLMDLLVFYLMCAQSLFEQQEFLLIHQLIKLHLNLLLLILLLLKHP